MMMRRKKTKIGMMKIPKTTMKIPKTVRTSLTGRKKRTKMKKRKLMNSL